MHTDAISRSLGEMARALMSLSWAKTECEATTGTGAAVAVEVVTALACGVEGEERREGGGRRGRKRGSK